MSDLFGNFGRLRGGQQPSVNAELLGRRAKSTANATRRLRRSASDNDNYAVNAETAIDETIPMTTHSNQEGVVFGVYGLDDWVTNTHMREAVESGQNTIAMDGTWIVPAGWVIQEWVMSKCARFNFMSTNRAIMFMDWGLVEVSLTRGKVAIELNGEPAAVFAFMKELDGELKRAENLIEWVYSQRGDSISVPLNYRPALDGAYPWLPKNIDEYINDYMNSDASVLILLGPPGTGKTTFIKNLIHRSGANAKVTYDEKVMGDDSLFAGFIEGDEKFLIMEDADTFLASREDGNTMMHRFLNVSDGLISAKDKKLVFSTNLPSVRDVDSALMRPGRCFDVVEFRALTRAEAEVVATGLGLTLPDGPEFTLAELFNVQPSGDAAFSRRVGFI